MSMSICIDAPTYGLHFWQTGTDLYGNQYHTLAMLRREAVGVPTPERPSTVPLQQPSADVDPFRRRQICRILNF